MKERQELAQPLITEVIAAERAGVSKTVVYRFIEMDVIRYPLTDADVCDLQRVRRLRELGVNITGTEIIIRMRRQIEQLQREMEQLEWEMEQQRRQLYRELAIDL